MRPLHTITLLVLVLIGLLSGRAHAGTEELASELRRLIAPDATEREQVLGALRALKDERLRPLFSELAVGQDMIGRVHGVLALAELTPDASATTSMISRVSDPGEQMLMIVRTLRDDLLSDQQIREIIGWPGLEEGLEVLLRSHIRKTDDPSMVTRMEELSTRESPAIGVVAALVLMDLGKQIDPESLMARLREQGVGTGSVGVAYLLDFIRREELSGAAPFVRLVLDSPNIDMMTRADALATMLVVSPEQGAGAWSRAWEGAEGLVDQIRLALAAVSAWRTAPMEVLKQVAGADNPVVSAMGAVAVAFVSGEQESARATDLWKTGYAPGIEWMIASIEYVREDARADVRAALLETPIEGMRSDSLVLRMLGDGLAEESPERLCEFARNAALRGDSRACRVALSAMARAGRLECAKDFDQNSWPDPGLTALARVVAAAAGSASVRAEQLEGVALGVGSQPRPVRAVAAWEALTRTGEDRRALAMILSHD